MRTDSEWCFCFRAKLRRSRSELRGIPGYAGRRLAGAGPRGWTRTGCPLWAPALTSPRYGLRSPLGPELSGFLPRGGCAGPGAGRAASAIPQPGRGLGDPPGTLGQPGCSAAAGKEGCFGALCWGCWAVQPHRCPCTRGTAPTAGSWLKRSPQERGIVFQRRFAAGLR